MRGREGYLPSAPRSWDPRLRHPHPQDHRPSDLRVHGPGGVVGSSSQGCGSAAWKRTHTGWVQGPVGTPLQDPQGRTGSPAALAHPPQPSPQQPELTGQADRAVCSRTLSKSIQYLERRAPSTRNTWTFPGTCCVITTAPSPRSPPTLPSCSPRAPSGWENEARLGPGPRGCKGW